MLKDPRLRINGLKYGRSLIQSVILFLFFILTNHPIKRLRLKISMGYVILIR